jgi:hypothetical protein
MGQQEPREFPAGISADARDCCSHSFERLLHFPLCGRFEFHAKGLHISTNLLFC